MVKVKIDPGNPGWTFIDPADLPGVVMKSVVLLKGGSREVPVLAFPQSGIAGSIQIDPGTAGDAGLEDGSTVNMELIQAPRAAALDLRAPPEVPAERLQGAKHAILMATNTRPYVAGQKVRVTLGGFGAPTLELEVLAVEPGPIGVASLKTDLRFS